MRKIVVVFAVLCLVIPTIHVPLVHAQAQKGPRSEMLDLVSFAHPDSCYWALKTGMIDIMAWPLSADQYEDAICDSNILLTTSTPTYFMYGFNFNANQTIKEYGDVWSPLSSETFRKAVACLVNKNYIISEIFEYNAERIDVPIPTLESDWWNTSVCYPNYPYEYDMQKAAQLLDNAGFRDVDGDGWRNYPSDWYPRDKAGQKLDPIVLVVDRLDNVRVTIAEYLEDQMLGIGIPVRPYYLYEHEIYTRVMLDHNYHIYMGSQLVNNLPIYLAILAAFTFIEPSFGNQWAYPNLWECWTSMLEILEGKGLPGLYEELRQAPTILDTIERSKRVQGRQTEGAFEVPICSLKSYFAYRKNIAGIVNENGYGLDNPYTFLNAYRTDDPTKPIRVGVPWALMKFNILYSIALQDYTCLDKNYAGLLSYQPYNLDVVQPWVAQDWEVGTWFDEEYGQEKTYVDYWFRKDVYWVKPVTGEPDGQFTAKDYEFTCYYIYDQFPFIPEARMGCPHLDKFKDIHHVEIIDDFHVRVYMNVSSMWAYLWPTYPLLPKHKWLREPLAYNKSAYFEANRIYLPGTLPLGEYVVSGSQDTKIKVRLVNGVETWLNWDEHFMWKKGELYVKTDSINGVEIDKLWVYYWANGDARGYYPGGLPWQDILEGCGTHYLASMTADPPGIGDTIVLRKNPAFFLETPILGEIDWAWKWVGTAKPRSGYYKIEIYDVTRASAAYCTRGDGTPNPKWFPGADIDPTDVGHVGIYDLVIITNNFAKTFGKPPE